MKSLLLPLGVAFLLSARLFASDIKTIQTTEGQAVPASALFAVYEANEIGADEELKGRTVRLYGPISSIGKDILGSPYITFVDRGNFLGVQCLFNRDQIPALARLEKGETIIVSGVVSGKLGNVLLRNCHLINIR